MPDPQHSDQIFMPLAGKSSADAGASTIGVDPVDIVIPPQRQRPDPAGVKTPPGAPLRLVVDPLTRIEGHLRIEAEVKDGKVIQAWSAGTMFRGIETILKGRDPRDAWAITQRICGVCTTVHALSSVRAVENALGVTAPLNARLIRNLMEGAQFIHDHVIHFYHLHGPDWVDVVSALSADPAATSRLARSLSDWPNSSADYFLQVRNRLQRVVSSGQLGIFANGYWGHPAYHLTPEANLMVLAHYLEALAWQREVIKIHAILGGKNPHPQTYLVGGMAVPVDLNSTKAINRNTIATLRQLAATAFDFVAKVYIPDLMALASLYPEWAQVGGGPGNFLSYGDFNGANPDSYWLPRGYVLNRNLSKSYPIDQAQVLEHVAHSWYPDRAPEHPYQGDSQPQYSGPQPPYDFLDTGAKYSWLKAPRYQGKVMEVGPLARMVVAYAAGHARIRQLIDASLANLNWQQSALFSTMGRILARGIETYAIAEQMGAWITQFENNINAGDLAVFEGSRWDPATWPADVLGFGATEAPRGALGHWVHIRNGAILNYQTVVPTTWNGSPRDGANQPGAWEQALENTPIADPSRPLEILRTIHSYDPCMSCAVHVLDGLAHAAVPVGGHV